MTSFVFNQIIPNQRVPGSQAEFSAIRALGGLPAAPNKILLVGQKFAAGSVPALTPRRIVQAAQGAAWFGQGSILSQMINAAIAANSDTELWAIALSDAPGSIANVSKCTFAGTATAAGAVYLMIGGRHYIAPVASGDTAASIAAVVQSVIQKDADRPVVATVAGAEVTLSARNKGLSGNEIDFRFNHYDGEALPVGITAAFLPVTTGNLNPSLEGLWAAIGDEQYQTIVLGQNDAAALTSADAEMESRWGPARAIEGRVYAGVAASYATLITLGNTRNGIFTTLIGNNLFPTTPWELAASVAATAAFQLHVDPARPLTDLVVPGVVAPRIEHRFTRAEREQLLRNGISTLKTLNGGRVAIERLISTRRLDDLNLSDATWVDVTTTATLGYYRLSWRARMAAKFPRAKLTDDTIAAVRAETIALAREWDEAGLMEDVEGFIAGLIVERDATNVTQLNLRLTPNVVNGLLQLMARIEFVL